MPFGQSWPIGALVGTGTEHVVKEFARSNGATKAEARAAARLAHVAAHALTSCCIAPTTADPVGAVLSTGHILYKGYQAMRDIHEASTEVKLRYREVKPLPNFIGPSEFGY